MASTGMIRVDGRSVPAEYDPTAKRWFTVDADGITIDSEYGSVTFGARFININNVGRSERLAAEEERMKAFDEVF